MRTDVERWRPSPAWLELGAEQRTTVVEAVGADLREVLDLGREIVDLDVLLEQLVAA